MSLPEKIYPVEYAGFWEFSPDGMYGPSFLHGDDFPNAEQIATEIARRYNTQPSLCQILETIADQLDRWANDSVQGGWSTHQVDANRKLADTIRRRLSEVKNI